MQNTTRGTIKNTLLIQNLKPFLETGRRAEVITVTDGILQQNHLQRLMTHEALGVHVKGFYDSHYAKQLGQELEAEVKAGKARNWRVSTARGNESSDVSTLGEHVPYNVACGYAAESSSALDDYFVGVQRELRSRRTRKIVQKYKGDSFDSDSSNSSGSSNSSSNTLMGRSMPQLWPLDKLRLELDEIWPGGAGLARDLNNKSRYFGGGLPRVMQGPTRWKRGFIHVDDFNPLDVNNGLFSANIYLQLPQSKLALNGDNGILHLWPLGKFIYFNKDTILNPNLRARYAFFFFSRYT